MKVSEIRKVRAQAESFRRQAIKAGFDIDDVIYAETGTIYIVIRFNADDYYDDDGNLPEAIDEIASEKYKIRFANHGECYDCFLSVDPTSGFMPKKVIAVLKEEIKNKLETIKK